MITVACVLWGNKFSDKYAQNLKSMVERNTTVPHRFICFSDRKIEGVETKFLRPGMQGWWNKLQLFDGTLKGRVVYLDLDTLITGNIDWLMNYDGAFAGIEDEMRFDIEGIKESKDELAMKETGANLVNVLEQMVTQHQSVSNSIA